jgi:hypothetical protein
MEWTKSEYMVLVENLKGTDHLDDLGVDERRTGLLEWHLVQDRDRWRAVVNRVMNLRVA